MSWILVRADFDPEPVDFSPIVEIFRDFGVENTLEDAGGLQGCLVDLEGSAQRAEELKAALEAAGASSVSVEPYVEQDWEIAWRQFFKPRRVGHNFLVVPSWEEAQPEPTDIVLHLDPGQAFGTGDHPTTRMCMELLETIQLAGKSVADVGCGSGILAIAAAKLGAEVLGVDIDPVALEVAKENAQRNRVAIRSYCGDGLEQLKQKLDPRELEEVPQDDRPLVASPTVAANPLPKGELFDVVVSNIISATLIRLGKQLVHALKPGGIWIVSGIIEQNWPDVKAAGEGMGMSLVRFLSEDGWVAAAFVRP